VLHQAAGDREIIPIEIDLEQVRRQRAMGLRGLGQVLKSFRDREVDFTVYDRDTEQDGYLQTLGPLAMPARGGSAGLVRRTPPSRGNHGARDKAKEADAHIKGTKGPTARF
jgi:hypothetical protein